MRQLTTLALCTALFLPAAKLAAQDSTQVTRNVPDSLIAKAKVNEDSARAIALKRVPGTVQSIRLERMHTRLVYMFEVRRAGRPGLTKVEVNAGTGHVMEVAQERAKMPRAARRSS